MLRISLLITLLLISRLSFSQESALQKFLSDSSMIHASVSLCIKDADSGNSISEYDPGKSLIPASVLKLITSGVALELLGPHHKFRTILGYTGTLNRRTGRLSGNIVIRGGGDPTLGSEYFMDNYKDFLAVWVTEIKKAGIKKVDGRIITDDTYYDFIPVSPKWQREDIGNYYGAGVYGLSVYDNTAEIHLKTADEQSPVLMTGINPKEYMYEFENRLSAYGTSDEGYVQSEPYSTHGSLTGTIPVKQEDFILKASIADPPLFIAGLLNDSLKASGLKIKEEPSTYRLSMKNLNDKVNILSEITSPPLSDLIEVLNHESVNLYAETLLKELGKAYRNNGSTDSGLVVVKEFFRNTNIPSDGLFIEDGSGLSPRNAISSENLVSFLCYMRNNGKYFAEYFKSLPEAGKNGTLRSYFRDPVFEGRMNAKSGSMTRVRCYAGYLVTNSDRQIAFSILVNNYSGSSQKVISGIEGIIKEIILYK